MKKIILELGIDEENKRFTISDKFRELPLAEMVSAIGLITAITHDWHHIHGEKQNEVASNKN